MNRLQLALCGLVALAALPAAAEDLYLDRFQRAQPIISATVEAYGGIDRLRAIETLIWETEGQNFQRYQSERLGPPFDAVDTTQSIQLDMTDGRMRIENSFGPNSNVTLAVDDKTYQLNPTTKQYTEGPATAVGEHFVHRIVPPLMARKLYERAANVLWLGESDVAGSAADALAITWPNGAQYVIHVDQASKLITQYDILFADPVVGDGVFKSVFSDYRETDGIPFPMLREQSIAGEQTFSIKTTVVRVNPTLDDAFALPDGYAAQAAGGGAPAEFESLGDGVWLAGGNYRTLFVDLGDELIAIDAGGPPNAATDKIRAAREQSGNKPLNTVVLTHHHSDHLQALGSYVAAGADVLAHGDTVKLARRVLKAKFASAGAPQLAEAKPKFDTFRDKKVLGGDTRRVELYNVSNGHAQNFIVAYVPHLKLLYGADVFGFPLNGPVPATSDDLRDFWKNLEKRGLDIETVANAHGRTAEFSELKARLDGA